MSKNTKTRDKLKEAILERDKWVLVDETTGEYYYDEDPRYTLKVTDDDGGIGRIKPQSYAVSIDGSGEDVMYSTYVFQYMGFPIHKERVVNLDSAGYTTSVPVTSFVYEDRANFNNAIRYRYLIEDSMSYAVHLFLYDDSDMYESTIRDLFLESVLVFETEADRFKYESYILENIDVIRENAGHKSKEDIRNSVKSGSSNAAISRNFEFAKHDAKIGKYLVNLGKELGFVN